MLFCSIYKQNKKQVSSLFYIKECRIFLFLFRLFPFPTEKKNPVARDVWKKLINRTVGSTVKLWDPSKDSRICSLHFVDGKPTTENPYPSLSLGYESNHRIKLFSPTSTKMKREIPKKYSGLDVVTDFKRAKRPIKKLSVLKS